MAGTGLFIRTFRALYEVHPGYYALDGPDPNTYTNFWCFGLHDRPWPERAVFGAVRYMPFEGMRRKTNVQAYIRDIG